MVQVLIQLGQQVLVLDRATLYPDAHNLSRDGVLGIEVRSHPVSGDSLVVDFEQVLRWVEDRLLLERLGACEIQVNQVYCGQPELLGLLVESPLDDVVLYDGLLVAVWVCLFVVQTLIGDDLLLEEALNFGIVVVLLDELELEHLERVLHSVLPLAAAFNDDIEVFVVDDLL